MSILIGTATIIKRCALELFGLCRGKHLQWRDVSRSWDLSCIALEKVLARLCHSLITYAKPPKASASDA